MAFKVAFYVTFWCYIYFAIILTAAVFEIIF